MISYFAFEDIKMFRGQHSLELKPLTILTGSNNSGKSTLISLINSLLYWFEDKRHEFNVTSKYSGEERKDKKVALDPENPLLTDFERGMFEAVSFDIKEMWVNDLLLIYNTAFKTLSSLHFQVDGQTVVTYENVLYNEGLGLKKTTDVKASNGKYLADEYHTKLIIHFNNLRSTYKQVFKEKNDQAVINEFLTLFEKDELISNLDKSYFNYKNRPMRLLGYKEQKGTLELLIYTDYYSEVCAPSLYGILTSYFSDLQISIWNNSHLQIEQKQIINDAFGLIFNKLLIPSLQGLLLDSRNSTTLDPYRGQFLEDPDSQANITFRNLVKSDKGSLVFTSEKEQPKGLSSYVEVFGKKDREYLNKWLKEFEIGKGLVLEEGKSTFKIKLDNGSLISPSELGFGSQQLLPILLEVIANPSGILFIGEPESHLHPYLQSKLADLFVDLLKLKKANDFQIIIETHSEFLIRKLQYLVATKEFDNDLVALYYIHDPEKEIPEGQKQIQSMGLREDGILRQEFGPGFFDESANLAINLLNIKKTY